MKDMKKKLSRPQFCNLIGVTSHNLDNRTRADQLSLAFGLQAPAVLGEYHRLDVFCHKLADALVERGFARETATAILREHWELWLLGLTRAEWEPSAVCYDPRLGITGERMIFFAVAREAEDVFHIAVGLPEEAIEALRKSLGGKQPVDMVFIRIADVLSDTLDAFQENGLVEWLSGEKGADFFTRPRGHREFPEWWAEIERLRQQSIDRLKTRVRVKRERRSAVRKAMTKIQREHA
jgi:hypothetical protein